MIGTIIKRFKVLRYSCTAQIRKNVMKSSKPSFVRLYIAKNEKDLYKSWDRPSILSVFNTRY